jgi:cGMP-dependent protein kinase 2
LTSFGDLQYASFQDRHHLYFLFDLLPGGDLMDILVAEAKVVKVRSTDSSMSSGCLQPKQRILKA